MTRSIRPYLEYQADRVEALLATHRTPGRITGGTVGPRQIRFFLNPAPHIRFSNIVRLQEDLALILHVSTLTVDRGKDGVILEFANPNPQSVSLDAMLAELAPLPVSTALLGLTDDGAPLLVRLSAPDVAHILVSGTTGSGKSVLMQSIAAALALNHTPRLLQMVCIDPKARTFTAFDGIGHLARPVITDVATGIEALHSLVREMERRDEKHLRPGDDVPRLVAFIDELADMVMLGGEALIAQIVRIAQRGRESGVHLVAATQHPASAILGSLMKANLPLRLVGQVVSADDARVASGRAGTNAHLLNGKGDFLAVRGGDAPIRFQVAYANEKALGALLKPLRGMVSLDVTGLRDWVQDHNGDTVIIEAEHPATLRPASRAIVPVMPREDQTPDGVHAAIDHLRPTWAELHEQYHDGRVNKSRLCRLIWVNASDYSGCWARWLDTAVEQLDAEISTSTSTATNAHIPAENDGEGHSLPGRGRTSQWDVRRLIDGLSSISAN